MERWRFRRRRLLEYYDYFSEWIVKAGDSNPVIRRHLRAANQRMDAIQRELPNAPPLATQLLLKRPDPRD
jgi:hypothetical protein